MSYMRSPWHIYPCDLEEGRHLISFHGPAVGWDAGEGVDPSEHVQHLVIPQEVFDELVMMRWAQLSPERRRRVARRAVERHGGNVGCGALKGWLRGQGEAGESRIARVVAAYRKLDQTDPADNQEWQDAWMALKEEIDRLDREDEEWESVPDLTRLRGKKAKEG